jgi:hypothetical protein
VLAPAGSASAATTTVDNATAGRFAASTSWGTSAWSGQKYAANYRFATPYTGGSDAAWFKASVAASGAHLVEVWYPGGPGLQQRHTVRRGRVRRQPQRGRRPARATAVAG